MMTDSVRNANGRFHRWTAALALLATAILFVRALAGEDYEGGNPELRTEAVTGALILVDGQLIEGRIERTSEGFVVVRPGSRVLLLSAQVRVFGKDRRDAYQKLRKTFPLDRPEPLVELGRWCIAHDLPEEARRELRAALHLAPNYAEARALFEKLEAVSADPAPQTSAVARLPGNPPLPTRILVTVEGRIIEGAITRNAGGYEVEMGGTRFVIPDAQVRVEATDRQQAYEKLRSTLPPDRPGPHVELARWCMEHALYDAARIELVHALRLDSKHTAARFALRQLEDMTNPAGAIHRAVAVSPPRTAEGFEPAEAVSLAGLSPEAAREFVLRVQPLLINKCGNAACHGPAAQREFSLCPVRPGQAAHRIYSERNLAAVLRRIDPATPLRSPLIVAPAGEHDEGQPVFRGRGGEAQRELLAGWVEKVAREMPELLPADEPHVASSAPSQAAGSQAYGGAVSASPLTQADEEFLREILREERPDAFDPDEFNRRFGNP